jgi:hypothetical protein
LFSLITGLFLGEEIGGRGNSIIDLTINTCTTNSSLLIL